MVRLQFRILAVTAFAAALFVPSRVATAHFLWLKTVPAEGGKQQAFLLDDNDFRHLYVPPGFLHGFQALTPTADVCYRIDRPHDPHEDIGVAYDDPDLGIAWPRPVTVVSARDAHADARGGPHRCAARAETLRMWQKYALCCAKGAPACP